MIIVRIIRGIAGVAGLGALTLGLLDWIANVSFISIHIVFGLTVALSLLILGIVGVFTKGMRLLGAIGIVYALIVTAFGLTQTTLLVDSLHWLIQAAHLLVGLGALALAGIIGTRYLRLKSAAAKAAVPEATVPQFEK
jgi:cellulose synthase/poly-beta-1,6-N-acetylglucosamine synthase-like glycosyltransferase